MRSVQVPEIGSPEKIHLGNGPRNLWHIPTQTSNKGWWIIVDGPGSFPKKCQKIYKCYQTLINNLNYSFSLVIIFIAFYHSVWFWHFLRNDIAPYLMYQYNHGLY
jgi:hypothetical protein